ncbi:MAG: hypothetical protein ACLQMH_03975, partial [Solirubrobacteraceae bacterium]
EEPIASAERGCPGSPNNPEATPGHLCVFTGGSLGNTEKEWTNAGYAFFAQPNGEETGVGSKESEEAFGGVTGTILVFRTGYKDGVQKTASEFKTGTIVKEIKALAYMPAEGSWAVTTE